MRSNWVQRRWLDFRNGHSVYLAFALTFVNFTVITFSLAVERLPFLSVLFPSMWMWAAFFVAIYIPSAIITGYIHMKKQVPREQEQIMENNPFAFKTAPGKEQLFNLPGAVIGYDMQLRGMRMHNQFAAAFEKIYNVYIDRWLEKDFENITWLKTAAEKLRQGADIKDIEERPV